MTCLPVARDPGGGKIHGRGLRHQSALCIRHFADNHAALRFQVCAELREGIFVQFDIIEGCPDATAVFKPREALGGKVRARDAVLGEVETRGNVNPIVTKGGGERVIESTEEQPVDISSYVIGVVAIQPDTFPKK